MYKTRSSCRSFRDTVGRQSLVHTTRRLSRSAHVPPSPRSQRASPTEVLHDSMDRIESGLSSHLQGKQAVVDRPLPKWMRQQDFLSGLAVLVFITKKCTLSVLLNMRPLIDGLDVDCRPHAVRPLPSMSPLPAAAAPCQQRCALDSAGKRHPIGASATAW